MTSDTIDATYTAFLELERRHGLFDLRVDDVPVWERVRKGVFDDLVLRDLPDAFGGDAGGTSAFLQYLITEGYADLTIKNPLFAGRHDLVFVNGRREKMSDGVWWNIYCDPLCEATDLSCLHLDPSEHYRKSPLKTDHVRPVRPLSIMGRIRETVLDGFDGVPDPVERRLEEVEEELATTFESDVAVTERVNRHFVRRSRLLPLYGRTLRRIDPAIAVAIPSWAGREIFIEACQNEGIPVVEMQHGTPNRYHLGYSYPNGTKEAFPDYLFTWGEFWTEDLELPIPDDRVFHVGFPALEMRRSEHPPGERADRLVVISQPTVGTDLSRLAVELADHDDIDLTVTYKLHPSEYGGWRDAYPWLERNDIAVVDGDGAGLYELFGQAAAQLGVYSTAIYEGLTYDLRTFLLDIDEVAFMDKLVATGAVETISTADQVAAGLGAASRGELELQRLFRSDAHENVRSQLYDVIE